MLRQIRESMLPYTMHVRIVNYTQKFQSSDGPNNSVHYDVKYFPTIINMNVISEGLTNRLSIGQFMEGLFSLPGLGWDIWNSRCVCQRSHDRPDVQVQ